MPAELICALLPPSVEKDINSVEPDVSLKSPVSVSLENVKEGAAADPAGIEILSLNVQASVEFTQLIVLSVAPLSVIPPPSAVVSVGVATVPNSIFLSST